MSKNNNKAIFASDLSKYYSLAKQRTFKEFLPALLSGKETKKSFKALNHLSFIIDRGESLGVIGRNGSGKSTLLKLIAGVTTPSTGKIEVYGRVAPMIELGAGFHPELTGRENIYLNGSILGIKRKQMDRLFPEIVEFSELKEFIDQPIKIYSSGMYMRLAFSVAVAETPDILLVDEILAVGDTKFQQKCLDRIREFQKNGATMVMVSHDLNQIKNYCSKALYLDQGNQILFAGTEEVIKKYQEMN